MKSNDFLNENIVSDAQEMHLDHEVQMARQECYHAAEDAITLHKLLRHMGEQQGLEGWVSAKITLAADYLNTVREHLEYQLMSGASEEPVEVVAIAENVITAEDLAPVDEATDMMAKERKKRLADAEKKKQERLAAEKSKKDKKQGVAEGSNPERVVVKFSAKEYAAMSPEQKAAKQQEWQQLKQQAKKRLQNFTLVDTDTEHGVAEGEVYDLEKEYGYEKPKAQPKKASVAPTRPSLHPDDTDFMDPVERRLRADRERVKAAWAAHNAKKGVAEDAGSVATVVNPTPKNKAKVGTLFGGTYKQKKAAK